MRRRGGIIVAGLAVAALALLAGAVAPGAAQAACKKANAATNEITISQARSAITCLVNERRRGMKKLDHNRKLATAAQRHSRKMRKPNCNDPIRHRCPGEPALPKRVRSTGYLSGARRFRLGEVISSAPASFTPRQAFSLMWGSSAHREVILDRFKHLGVGVATGGGSAYWTLVFGWKSG